MKQISLLEFLKRKDTNNYVFHGTPIDISKSKIKNKLLPKQANDENQIKENLKKAVYATNNIQQAIAFAIVHIPHGNCSYSIESKRGKVILTATKNILNNLGEGFVYVCDKEKFTFTHGNQYFSRKSIIPVFKIKVSPSDFKGKLEQVD